ncbi:hypothetical protein [Mesorhizobium sp.]|nr:hypothetical protein [Mesorhizobium sp.]
MILIKFESVDGPSLLTGLQPPILQRLRLAESRRAFVILATRRTLGSIP